MGSARLPQPAISPKNDTAPDEIESTKKLSENGWNALCLKEFVARQVVTTPCHRSRCHGPPQDSNQAASHDLGDSRRTLAADRAHPQGVLAQEAHRSPRRQLAEDAQRDHLPDEERL